MKTKQKRKVYITDSRRYEIVRTALKNLKRAPEEYKELLPLSYAKLTKAGIKLRDDQVLYSLYSTFDNDNKVNYIVLRLKGKGNIMENNFWALWELTFVKKDGVEYAVPNWKGFVHDYSFIWR